MEEQTNKRLSSPESFMVALHNGPSRVRLGTLDGVAAADCIEDLKDTILCQLEDLLHIHPFQRNNPSGSLLIPVPKEDVLLASNERCTCPGSSRGTDC